MSSKSAYDLLIAHVMLIGLLGTLDSLSQRITHDPGISYEKAKDYKAVFDSVFEEIDICVEKIYSAVTESLAPDKPEQT